VVELGSGIGLQQVFHGSVPKSALLQTEKPKLAPSPVITAKRQTTPASSSSSIAEPKLSIELGLSPDHYYSIGVNAEAKGDLPTALENYVLAFNCEPTNPTLRNALSNIESQITARYPTYHANSFYFTSERDARCLLNYGVRMYALGWNQQATELDVNSSYEKQTF